ncbi:hypothetical protein HYV10_03030 [Candidatus Dependentiae bacterium]|nr:hypothetical protein [Candidatus Dependentiae bacterium]
MNIKTLFFICLCYGITITARDILVEAKASYFFFTNSLSRKIYGTGSGLFGGEVTAEIGKNFYGWVSGSFLTKKGYSLGGHDATRVTMAPVGVGLKYMYSMGNGDIYVGLGALPTYLKTKDCSPFVIPIRSGWGIGGIVKAGYYQQIYKGLYIDIFADYSFAKVKFPCCDELTIQSYAAHVNGVSLGLGIVYRF